jgi:pyruvate dehydrogenase E1 component beta subunit
MESSQSKTGYDLLKKMCLVDLKKAYRDADQLLVDAQKIVVEEAPLSGGWGSEIIATVTKELFSSLVSAPFRITTPDTPVPFNGGLEAKFAPNPSDVCRQILESVKNNSVPDAWWINEGVAK